MIASLFFKHILILTILQALQFGVAIGSAQEANVKEVKNCYGPFKDRSKPAPETLKRILKEHEKWVLSVNKPKRKGKQANLCRADLREADLTKAKLYKANLTEANLRSATLSKANLREANLTMADLIGADLTKANLWGADLTKAKLYKANLTEARLFQTNLTEAQLPQANLTMASPNRANLTMANLARADLTKALFYKTTLTKADLSEADLTEARLREIDFKDVDLDLKPAGIPYITDFWKAKNLEHVSFRHTPQTLVELREAFKSAGMRQQEREITYAIEHSKRIKKEKNAQKDGKIIDWGAFLEAKMNYYFLELTCDWGMSPGKPLRILVILIAGFCIFYMIAVDPHPNVTETGVWKILPEDRVLKREGEQRSQRIVATSFFHILLWGLYISILSAFHIGWRELNVGSWISRLQPREFTIRTTGWIRVVSGIQSLTSVYLVALSVLTYFGRPFE